MMQPGVNILNFEGWETLQRMWLAHSYTGEVGQEAAQLGEREGIARLRHVTAVLVLLRWHVWALPSNSKHPQETMVEYGAYKYQIFGTFCGDAPYSWGWNSYRKIPWNPVKSRENRGRLVKNHLNTHEQSHEIPWENKNIPKKSYPLVNIYVVYVATENHHLSRGNQRTKWPWRPWPRAARGSLVKALGPQDLAQLLLPLCALLALLHGDKRCDVGNQSRRWIPGWWFKTLFSIYYYWVLNHPKWLWYLWDGWKPPTR